MLIIYHKNPKNFDTWNVCCNYPKICTMWFYHRVMHPKDADRMSNSVVPDQNALESFAAVWSNSTLFALTFCPKLRIIRVFFCVPNFEKVSFSKPYWFWLVCLSICLFVCHIFYASRNFGIVHARVLKFHIWIPYGTRNVSKVHACPCLAPWINNWPISNLTTFTNIFISNFNTPLSEIGKWFKIT